MGMGMVLKINLVELILLITDIKLLSILRMAIIVLIQLTQRFTSIARI